LTNVFVGYKIFVNEIISCLSKGIKMKNGEKTNHKNYKVHSLERGLDLIELMTVGPNDKSLSELSAEAEFNQSTTHRILSALKSRGYVRQNPENLKYRLSLKVFELGNKIIRHLNMREMALPVLEDLAHKTKESAYLIIRDEDDALCLERVDGNPSIRILTLEVGGRQPLHLGAAPKILLAHLDEKEIDRIIEFKGLEAWTEFTITNPIKLKHELKKIKEQGYALSLNDVTEGVAAVGCPVFNWRNDVVAAISLGGMATNFKEERLKTIIDTVKAETSYFSQLLGNKTEQN